MVFISEIESSKEASLLSLAQEDAAEEVSYKGDEKNNVEEK